MGYISVLFTYLFTLHRLPLTLIVIVDIETQFNGRSVSASEENKHVSGLYNALAIIIYSIAFYRPTTLQPASRLDSKTFLTEFI